MPTITPDYDIQNPHQLAVLRALIRHPDKQITLAEINLLPVFDGLRDIKEAARAAKVALVKNCIIRMRYRGVYVLND